MVSQPRLVYGFSAQVSVWFLKWFCSIVHCWFQSVVQIPFSHYGQFLSVQGNFFHRRLSHISSYTISQSNLTRLIICSLKRNRCWSILCQSFDNRTKLLNIWSLNAYNKLVVISGNNTFQPFKAFIKSLSKSYNCAFIYN